jgi:hypothetical protein
MLKENLRTSFRSAPFLLVTASVAAGACGGNIVARPQAGTGGVSTVTDHTGGVTTTTSLDNPGGAAPVTSSSSVASSSSSGAPGCSGDEPVFTYGVLWPSGISCFSMDAGNTPAEETCIQSMFPVPFLSPGCTHCLAQDLDCARSYCNSPCTNDPTGKTCAQCRQTSCAGAFTQCSGRLWDFGAMTCSVAVGNPSTSLLATGLSAGDFFSADARDAYDQYVICACSNGMCPACQTDPCTSKGLASPGCASCIEQQCAKELAACQMN